MGTILASIILIVVAAACINTTNQGSVIEFSNICVDISDEGQLYIVWEEYDDDDYLSETKRQERSYKEFIAIIDKEAVVRIDELVGFPNEFSGHNFVVDHSGNIHFISNTIRKHENYPKEGDICYMKYNSELCRETELTHLTNYEVGIYFPKCAVDQNNDIYVVWQKSYSPDGKIVLMKINDNGEILANEKIVSEGEANEAPQIFTDSDGFVHLSWQKIEGNTQYCKIASNGSIIKGPIPLKECSKIQGYPIVSDDKLDLLYLDHSGVVDSSNNVHIFHLEIMDESYDEYSLIHSELKSSGQFSYNETIYSEVKYMENLLIKIDSYDNIHLAWIEDNAIYYTKLNINGTKLIDRMLIAKVTSNESAPAFLDIGITAVIIATVAMVIYFKKFRS